MTLTPKIAFAGTPANAARTLEALIEANYEIGVVITREDAPVGRKQVLTPSPVATVAELHSLPIIKANNLTEDEVTKLDEFDCDLGVVVAYGALLKKNALEALEHGWFNLHYSALPKYRGASPVQAALAAGEHETAVTLFKLDEGMDSGAIFGQVGTLINPAENAGDLLARLTELGVSLLLERLPLIRSGLARGEAQAGEPTYCGKISRAEARLDFTKSAIQNEHLVRAFNPEPGAWTTLGADSVKVLDARALGSTDWASLGESAGDFNGAQPDVGRVTFEKNRVLVHCGSGTLLELRELQPAGKKPMSANDWARGQSGREVLFQ
jgi:methionyl-tRNA formyltransferase